MTTASICRKIIIRIDYAWKLTREEQELLRDSTEGPRSRGRVCMGVFSGLCLLLSLFSRFFYFYFYFFSHLMMNESRVRISIR